MSNYERSNNYMILIKAGYALELSYNIFLLYLNEPISKPLILNHKSLFLKNLAFSKVASLIIIHNSPIILK